MATSKYNGGTRLEQADYESLTKGGSVQLTDERAKAWINDELGFEFSQIRIVREVATYKVDDCHRIVVDQRYQREPRYGATDWNYVRFNVKGWQYEMIDGELYLYED